MTRLRSAARRQIPADVVPPAPAKPIIIPTPASSLTGRLRRRLSPHVAISGGISLLCNEEFPLLDIPHFVEEHPELGSLRILASYAYVASIWKNGPHQCIAPHRFVLLRLQPELGDPVWLRLDRYPISKVALIRGLGKTVAKDKALFLGDTQYIQSQPGYKQENTQEFADPHPTLNDLCRVIEVVTEIVPNYTLWPQNCWMLSSLVQDLLGAVGEVSHAWRPVLHRNLWPVVRARSKRRLYQFYNIPEPITLAVMLCILQDDIRFKPIRTEITRAIGAYDKWELSVESASSKTERRLLPQLINNIGIITGEMDNFGQRDEAASFWRQMVLVLHRTSASHAADSTFLLALATEQYGIYLAACARLEEATRVDSEAVALALNTEHSGSYAECGITYWLFRQRTLFKRNKHAEVCSDASRLVSHCRRLHSIEPKGHMDTLALVLIRYSRSLKQVGRHREAEQALREVMNMLAVQMPHIYGGESPLSDAPPARIMPSGVAVGEPARFKLPLADQFLEIGLDEWEGDAFTTAAEAEVRAVALTRTLDRHSGAFTSPLAKALQNYGVSASSCGRHEAARDAHAEAVQLTRELFLSNQRNETLAQRLQNYADSLRDCGQLEAARDADAEAVDLTRELYRVKPQWYRRDLAQRLEIYGDTLRECRQWEAERDVNAETVALTRELYRFDPNQYRDDLARRLQIYGPSLRSCGQSEATRDANAEAVELTRELHRVDPDQSRNDLAQRLEEYSISLSECGESETACIACAEAVEYTRESSEAHLDQSRDDLARRLESYGISLRKCGHSEAERDANAEAVELTRELFRINPDAYRDDLARRVQHYGASLLQRGELEAACDANSEAVELTREIFLVYPSSRSDLAKRLENYGVSLSECGQLDAAREACAESVELTRDLCLINSSMYREDLARRLENYSLSLSDCRQMEDACDANVEAVKLTIRLYHARRGRFGDHLARRIENYNVSLGRRTASSPWEARHKQQAVELARELQEIKPDLEIAHLARRLEIYGLSLVEWGGFDALCEGVKLTRELYETNPDRYRDSLARGLQHYGLSLRRRKESEAARDAIAECVELTRELHRVHSDQSRDDFAQRLGEYGVSLTECGEWEAARDAYAEAVALARDRIKPVLYRNYGDSLRHCGESEAACNADADADAAETTEISPLWALRWAAPSQSCLSFPKFVG